MATQSAPLVSLQAPKDVSLSEIEAELGKIWQSYSSISSDGATPAATRAATFTLVVYEPEETQILLATLGFYTGPIDGIMGPRMRAALKAAQEAYGMPIDGKPSPEILNRLRQEFLKRQDNPDSAMGVSTGSTYIPDARGSGIADAIASQNPCRIIALCPVSGADEGVTAQVSAYCPIQKQSRSVLICCEYITLKGTEAALARVSPMIQSLLIPELPGFAWWKGTPSPGNEIFDRLSSICNSVIVDSSYFHEEAEEEMMKLQSMLEADINVADLNWRRLAAWQELTAEAFDPPERRAALREVDRVTIDYEKGNPAQAFMFLGWLASRLQWKPVSYRQEGGDYAIKRIQFVAPDQRSIDAELAAIPTGDWGEIAGDLVGLRLTSTNMNADCCTVLCSETTGCMRMEAGGNAQSCRVNQVTPLFDQKAETLLSQQLLRWGQDMLYTESMAVTAQIIRMKAE